MSKNKGKQEERRKIQIDVAEDARLRLEAILERTPTASRNELFQRALQLLEWAIDEKRAGSRVMVADDRGALKKLEFPFLESVTPQPDLAPELSVETVGATTNIHISLIDPAVYSAIQQHPELLRTLDWRTFEKLLADESGDTPEEERRVEIGERHPRKVRERPSRRIRVSSIRVDLGHGIVAHTVP